MATLQEKVALRFIGGYDPAATRVAGLFYPPPAMFRDIYEWVLAVVAATALNNQAQKEPPDFSRYAPVQQAAEDYKANPTSWKLYSELYQAMWIFGHPGPKASVRDFQKLTPEKRKTLESRADNLYGFVRDRVQGAKEFEDSLQAKDNAEKARLQAFLLPGVGAITQDSVQKMFPIDLAGWKYGEAEIHKRVEEVVKRDKERAQKFYDQGLKADLDQQTMEILRQMLNPVGWNSIRVVLTQEKRPGVKAFWQEGLRQIVITVPYQADPQSLTDLASTLRHELQHFAQSFLAYTISKSTPVGLPSKKIQTPEYKQRMTPGHPNYAPDALSKQLLQRFKDKGINPKTVNFHDLDDVEFHTELVDAIDEFKTILRRAPPGPLDVAIKMFTGAIPTPSTAEDWEKSMEALGGYSFAKWFTVNRAFAAWKAQAPGKYQKAVKEFVKAVS